MDEYQVNSIALKTLKQRCEYLQWRLNAVEEENCKLKLERAQDLNTKTSKGLDSLEGRIITLNKEKTQMAHHIQMITNENSTLWEQLSKFLPESNMSSLKFSVSPAPNSQVISQYESPSKEYDKESLEEISLKLINGIIMGKNELEKQYSQMVDLQKENLAEATSSFSHKQNENRVAAKNMKDYVQKLKEFRQALFKQKTDLSRAILFLKNSPIILRQSINANNRDNLNFNHVSSYRENNVNTNQPGSEFSTLQDPERLGNGDQPVDSNEMVCPMCWSRFTGLFEDFSRHVSLHFDDDNDEFVDAIANFESLQ